MLILDGEGLDRLGQGIGIAAIIYFAIICVIIVGIFAFLNSVRKRIDSKNKLDNTDSNKETVIKSNLVIEDSIITKLNNSDPEINTSKGTLRSVIDWILIVGLYIIAIFILVIIILSFFK